MSPRELKANHMIRVQNSLWDEARAIAKFRGESLSEVIRAALVAYVKKHGKELS